MLKGSLSHSKIYFEACTCPLKADRSSTKLTSSKIRRVPARQFSTINYEPSTSERHKQTPRGYWKEQTNLRNFIDDLGKKIGIEKPDDWYQKLSKNVFLENGGRGLLTGHNNSPIALLMTAYPEHNWVLWKFNKAHQGYWNNKENQRKFFDDLEQQLDIQNKDDWYQKLSKRVLLQKGGRGLLSVHKNSPIAALMAAYPEHNWVPWKFNIVSRGYWNDLEHQKNFFDDLGHKLGVEKPDDWYQKLSYEGIMEHGGAGLLEKYKASPYGALVAAYPNHIWIPWKFNNVNRGHWSDKENHKKFFDELGVQLGVDKLEDWYQKLSVKVISENGGASLLFKHNGSPTAALMAAYPEHNWMPWKFNQVSQEYWSTANQRKFFDDLGLKLGVQKLDDWYQNLSYEAIIEHRGAGLLALHKQSAVVALMAAYPEHTWMQWKFNTISKGIWNSTENVGAFLSELSEKLSIQNLDDWYRVDMKQLQLFGASTLVRKYNGLYNLLKEQYPNHPWDLKRFKQVGKKGQRWLAVTLKKMFPNEGKVD